MGLQFIQSGLDFSTLVVEGRQFLRGPCGRVEDRRRRPVERLGVVDSLQLVLDYPHHHIVRAVPPVTLRRVDTTLLGTASQIRDQSEFFRLESGGD
jgi:hypothetical protein